MTSDFATDAGRRARELLKKQRELDDLKVLVQKRSRATAAQAAERVATRARQRAAADPQAVKIERLAKELDGATDPAIKADLGMQLTLERLKRLHQRGRVD